MKDQVHLIPSKDPASFLVGAFPDLPSREPTKAKFHESAPWKEGLLLLPMLEKYEVVKVTDNEHLIHW